MLLYIRTMLLLTLLLYKVENQCCLNIQDRVCIKCPNGTHLYRGNCINNVENCDRYINGFDCDRCIQGYTLIRVGGECINEEIAPLVADQLEEIIDVRNPAKQYIEPYLLSLNIARNS